MTGYRFRRRAFLASVGGALGLSALLRNLEAAAEGEGSPPRLLVMLWPNGVIPYLFEPTGTGRNYQTSTVLQPFEQAGLREDLALMYGFNDIESALGGGGSEAGVVLRMTGVSSPGTRQNGGEQDDSVAGGPSFDRIFAKRLAALASPGLPVNVICDARVDSHETSAQCMSYAYETRQIESANPGGPITEHVPLMPELSPAKLYTQLFSGFMPGGATNDNQLELAKALQLRKSVLDYALGELAKLNDLAPSSERPKIEIHADAIRQLELQLSGDGATTGSCEPPAPPDPALAAQTGSNFYYADPTAPSDESAAVAEIGRLHLAVLRAAFQCDITRVATFQWASGVDQVAFQGLYPDDPEGVYRHHPTSHRIFSVDPQQGSAEQARVLEFLGNVHTWYNQKTADALVEFKNTHDVFGNSLLDSTIAAYLTEVADPTHRRSPLPALIFGGRKLGIQGGQYLDFTSKVRPFNDVWLTLAQAFAPELDVTQHLADELFMQQQASKLSLISELWQRPA